MTSDGNGVAIDLSAFGGGTITLSGFSVDDLDSSDFVFRLLDGGGTSEMTPYKPTMMGIE